METLEAHRVGSHRDELGEGPVWDRGAQRLVWVDIMRREVHQLVGERLSWGRSFEIAEPVGAAVPSNSGSLMLAAGRKFLWLDDEGRTSDFAEIESSAAGRIRFNDAKCDPRGRLLAGWIDEAGNTTGELCRLDPDGSVATVLTDVELANGLDWSPDGETFYFIDTLSLGVDAFDYDLDSGELDNRRNLVKLPRGGGAPDGMTVDSEGCLWVAVLCDAVHRYSPSGELLAIVEAATDQVTSCAFGGPDGRDLFITSLSVGLPPHLINAAGISDARLKAIARDERKGELYVCRPGVSGPSAYPFAA
jgi:sugar lactone lactonase YvrE